MSWQEGMVDQENSVGQTGNTEGPLKVDNYKFKVKTTFLIVLGLFQEH